MRIGRVPIAIYPVGLQTLAKITDTLPISHWTGKRVQGDAGEHVANSRLPGGRLAGRDRVKTIVVRHIYKFRPIGYMVASY